MYIRTYFEVSKKLRRIVMFQNLNPLPTSSKCFQKSRSFQTVHVMSIPPTPTATSFLVRLCCASSQQASGSPDSRISAADGPEVSAVCRVTPGSLIATPPLSPPAISHRRTYYRITPNMSAVTPTGWGSLPTKRVNGSSGGRGDADTCVAAFWTGGGQTRSRSKGNVRKTEAENRLKRNSCREYIPPFVEGAFDDFQVICPPTHGCSYQWHTARHTVTCPASPPVPHPTQSPPRNATVC